MAIARNGEHTLKGKPLTLLGPRLAPGDTAPDFHALDKDFQPVRLGDTPRKVRIFSVVPSLDTPVCDRQSRRFNQEAGSFGDRVAVYTVSRDTPFAQSRWCGAADATNMTVLSDLRDGSFGLNWGVQIEEMGLLARSVFVVDPDGIVHYAQYVPEFADLPEYEPVLAAVRALL